MLYTRVSVKPKMPNKKATLAILLVIFLSSGCSSRPTNNQLEISFSRMFPIENINKDISFEYDIRNPSEIRYGELVRLILHNNSSNTINFQTDDYVRLFIPTQGNWVEIDDNLDQLYLEEEILLAPKGTALEDSDLIIVSPNYLEYLSSLDVQVVRVFVQGRMSDNVSGSAEKVAAFIDLRISLDG
jgi:hypothetical protein